MERPPKILGYLLTLCFIPFILFFSWSAIDPVKSEGSGQNGSSGDATLHDERVKEEEMTDRTRLTDKEGKYLLAVARNTIEKNLFNKVDQEQEDSDLLPKYQEKRGTFVTITIDENLRGCIGHIIPQESLIEGIRVNAINAAFRDPRFQPLSKEEWEKIKVEISILTEPKPLEYSDADELLRRLSPGVDGVILKKGFLQATFLPQVWDQLPDKKDFLTHLCIKAGLDGYAWKNERLEVLTYQVQAFEEH
ncbi:AmmeMemoRadiSam system protein A [Deltaproteobacteria bacterium]|nr:AmmeMemoRadiSam system protein A [Deltaproteobacteria bacterium]